MALRVGRQVIRRGLPPRLVRWGYSLGACRRIVSGARVGAFVLLRAPWKVRRVHGAGKPLRASGSMVNTERMERISELSRLPWMTRRSEEISQT